MRIKRLILLLIFTVFYCLAVANFSRAINPLDEIAPNDKQLHFMANYIMTDVAQNGWKWEPWQAFLLIEGLGIAKEQLDVWTGGKWDNSDRMANRAGWLAYNVIQFNWGF